MGGKGLNKTAGGGDEEKAPGEWRSPWREKSFENENNDILPYGVNTRYTPF